ncbi:MAG: Wzz/FepE/Etk N-terminal domain-containing protein, partial [Pseudomonadales bacterium]
MSESSNNKDSRAAQAAQGAGERLVYVMPEQAFGTSADDEISLRDLWDILWRGKWLIIAVTMVFAFGSVTYALLAEEWYRAEVLLAPADEKSTSGLGGQLGGLAALAGVTVGGGDSAEALAFLGSRGFARDFIEDYDLVPMFYADQWDAVASQWLGADREEWPEIRDAVKFFHENILSINQDRESGLVTLAVEWLDPQVAATWAETLVRRLNTRLRERALREAETNVAYLQSELAQTSVVTLQQSIGRLLESELQKLMLARGNEEFAFRVIDEAVPP